MPSRWSTNSMRRRLTGDSSSICPRISRRIRVSLLRFYLDQCWYSLFINDQVVERPPATTSLTI